MQSVGGGGGLVSGDANSLSAVTFTPGARGDGGDVAVSLSNGASVRTQGDGAFGVLAQSVGGGGFAADSTQALTGRLGPNAANSGSGIGSGGSVDVYVGRGASISTSGANAHGVFAQTVTGGGGVWSDGTAMIAGTSSAGPVSAGDNALTVEVWGDVAVSGGGAWGVYAQSAGADTELEPVSVQVAGALSAGQGAAGAVTMSSYSGGNILTTTASGRIVGNVVSVGLTESAILPASASSAVSTLSSGKFLNAGTFVTDDFASGLDVVNDGAVNLGGSGVFAHTTFSQDFSGTGQIEAIDLDLAQGLADRLVVEGSTSGAQTLGLAPQSLVKGAEARFLRTLGADDLTLSFEPGSLFSFEVGKDGGWRTIRATEADFTGYAKSFGRNARGAAAALQSAWDLSAGGKTGAGIMMDRVFSTFHAIDGAELNDRLQAVTSSAASLAGSLAMQDGISAANGVMSCPSFAAEGVMISEGQCAWFQGVSEWTDRDRSPDQSGYDSRANGFALGGQVEVSPDWFVAGNVSWTDYDTDFTGGTERVSGTALGMAVALKHQLGPWIVTGALGGGVNDADSMRRIVLGDLSGKARGEPDSRYVFARARVAYEIPKEAWYLRPTLDLDAISFRQDGYTEKGAGDLSLRVSEGSETFLAATPLLEVGGRLDREDGSVLRLYATGGVTFSNQDSFTSKARFMGALDGAPLEMTASVDDVAGRFGLNLDLQTPRGFEVRIGYDLLAGSDLTSQSGQLRLAWRF